MKQAEIDTLFQTPDEMLAQSIKEDAGEAVEEMISHPPDADLMERTEALRGLGRE